MLQSLNRVPGSFSGNRNASWRLFEDHIYSISCPDYVIQALGERIDLSTDIEESLNHVANIVWNPEHYDSLKQHFWNGNLGPENLVEYRNAEKHLFLGAFHYELLDIKTGNIQFYNHTEGKDLQNQFGYPFLRWIGKVLNKRGYAPIHAAAIGDNENFILIPGKATAGKSTTTATWMIHDGAFLSDDFVFLSGNSAKGYYKGINLRQKAHLLLQDSVPEIYQKFRVSHFNQEKIFLHENSKSQNHQTEGRPLAIWCPEKGYNKPELKRISALDAYNSLLSSLQLNKEYGFDLRLCHNLIKNLVKKLPAYAICLTEDISENYSFMKDVFQSMNQD